MGKTHSKGEKLSMIQHQDDEEGQHFNKFRESDSRDSKTDLRLQKMRRKSLFQGHKMKSFESFDYRVADDQMFRDYNEQDTHNKVNGIVIIAKWLIYLFIGIFTGIAAFTIKKGVNFLSEFKYEMLGKYLDMDTPGTRAIAFFVYYAICTLYAMVACCIVLILGPLAGGSGIPELKGYLNGVHVGGTVNLKTFAGKVLSIIPAFASGLALGPEGPMVHIGGMIGGGLSSAKSRTLHIRLPKVFEKLRTPREQRDFISSGTAAGIAAAFGAPIGGLLFSLEETSSYWSRELTWRTFFGCMIATFSINFMFHVTSPAKGGLVNDYGLLTFGISRNYLYRYEELVAFLFLGVINGVLGGFFVILNIHLNKWRRDHLQLKKFKLLEVFIIITITTLLAFTIPMGGTCRPVSDIRTLPNIDGHTGNITEYPNHFFCKEGEFNDFSLLFLSPQDEALKSLYSRTEGIFGFPSMIVFLVVQFFLVLVVAGTSVAAGLFVPMMLVGALIGRIVGEGLTRIFSHVNPPIDPSIYALVSSAAMMSGFSRVTISLVVIVLELTETTQFLLPIMLGVLSAKWVGDAISKSIYDEQMELKSITLLDFKPPKFTHCKTVSEVMKTEIVCLREVETVEKIIQILSTTSHNGFPVIRVSAENRQRTYSGLILRKTLLILLHSKKYYHKEEHPPAVLDWQYFVSLTNHKWDIETVSSTLPERTTWDDLEMDLKPYIDRSQPLVVDTSSFRDAYRTFQMLGLRHLPVIDSNFQVVGILTRHDLLSFYNPDLEDASKITF